MKGIIVYKGRYGATKQYAEWLAEELNIPAFSAEKAPKEVSDYGYLIIGSSVYVGKLEIRNWLKKNIGCVGYSKIFFYQVSGTPIQETDKLESYLRSGIPKEMRKRIEVFFLPGKLDIKKLSWIDRFLLRTGARLSKGPAEKKEMLTDYNHVKKENLSDMIKNVKKLSSVVQL